jgi:uncharacterized membrane protein
MLILAALVWLALHFLIAGTRLRGVIVRTIGEGAFRGAFSVLSIIVLIWLAAPTMPPAPLHCGIRPRGFWSCWRS